MFCCLSPLRPLRLGFRTQRPPENCNQTKTSCDKPPHSAWQRYTTKPQPDCCIWLLICRPNSAESHNVRMLCNLTLMIISLTRKRLLPSICAVTGPLVWVLCGPRLALGTARLSPALHSPPHNSRNKTALCRLLLRPLDAGCQEPGTQV